MTVELAELERTVKQAAGAIMVDPRVLRRVIKHHRGVRGVVPHGRCYVIERASLAELTEPEEIGEGLRDLQGEVLLLARPSPRELASRDRRELVTRVWRTVFHARVHQALEKKVRDGGLSDVDLRRRIGRIGQTEFDEIRAILRHDDLVMPPGDDREVYIEFAALYLELRNFSPGLLLTTFPGLDDHERVAATLAQDLDVVTLLADGRPGDVLPVATTRALAGTSMPSFSAPATFGLPSRAVRNLGDRAHSRLLRRADLERARGNDVRAALLCSQATAVDDAISRKRAGEAARDALRSLQARMAMALRGTREGERIPDWTALLRMLAVRATQERNAQYTPEARLLYELQRAAVSWEKPERAVDVASWMLSFGKLAVVRDLPATRELRVARYLHLAQRRVRHVRIDAPDRKLLAKGLSWALERAEANVRAALKPRLDAVFDRVGLLARGGPEQLARVKVIEELLDTIIDDGFLTLPGLRDALSRNQLKLEDLEGVEQLWGGDALLEADAALARTLDGVYRRGDVYMRGLQKLSSVPFGTQIGRLLTLYLVLPLGASFLLLEGVGHLLNPILGALRLAPVEVLTWTSFSITTAFLLALLHSSPFRAFARQVLEVLGLVLATLFLRLPRFVLGRPVVRRWLARPRVRLVLRRVVFPLLVGGAVYLLALTEHAWWLRGSLGFGVALMTSLVMGSRLGAWLEDFVFDELAPTWHVFSRQWVPGLFRMISRFFAALMDLLQRAINRVDELLRFREGQGVLMMVLKGAFGFVWGIVAYVVRLYATLLVEPEINPLKHFPTVTVAHKLMLPVTPALLVYMQAALSPLGTVISGAVAGVTVFLLPSASGFLAWELKENYKLYRATRPDRLTAAPVGLHGETMRGLLVLGFHSGTLPKLYERLRRAAQREDEAAVVSLRAPRLDGGPGGDGLGRFREGIRHVEQAVRRFVDRELVAILHRCPRWTFGEIEVERVDLSSNRIRVELGCSDLGATPCTLTFEEQSGFVVAGVGEPGFLVALKERTELGVLLFENALAGLYQRAEVDLVREQIEAELGEGIHYDVADEGLVVWPGHDYETELVYRIDTRRARPITPKVRGVPPKTPPRVLDTGRMLYRQQEVSWLAWVAAWDAADHEEVDVPRLLSGSSILPPLDVEFLLETPQVVVIAAGAVASTEAALEATVRQQGDDEEEMDGADDDVEDAVDSATPTLPSRAKR